MAAKEELLNETVNLMEQCNVDTLTRIFKLNQILVGLSAAQLEYLLELSNLLFGQPPK